MGQIKFITLLVFTVILFISCTNNFSQSSKVTIHSKLGYKFKIKKLDNFKILLHTEIDTIRSIHEAIYCSYNRPIPSIEFFIGDHGQKSEYHFRRYDFNISKKEIQEYYIKDNILFTYEIGKSINGRKCNIISYWQKDMKAFFMQIQTKIDSKNELIFKSSQGGIRNLKEAEQQNTFTNEIANSLEVIN